MTVSMNTTISTKKAVPQGDIGSGGVPSRRAGAAAAVGFAGIAAYQVALALGAPFGSAAWGGAHPGTLPPGLRVASGVGAALWGFAALIILQRVGLSSVLPFGRMFVRRATWVLVVLSCMSAVANFASQSAAERFILAPVVIALAVLCFIVARRTAADLQLLQSAAPPRDPRRGPDAGTDEG
jgi:hypothetical protein